MKFLRRPYTICGDISLSCWIINSSTWVHGRTDPSLESEWRIIDTLGPMEFIDLDELKRHEVKEIDNHF